MPRLFLPQSTLEEWVLQEKADLREGNLLLPAEKAAFPILPAVHFVKVVSGTDVHKLVTKVKTQEQLVVLSAEQMSDSVLLGDDAYEVVPGYVLDVGAGTPGGKSDSPETDLLAEFLLNKLG